MNLQEKKVRGFAGIIEKVLAPLNENKKFKENFSDINVKILLNATNVNFAALIIIKNGTIRVESLLNKPKENLNKEKVGWDAFLQMDTQIFLAFAMMRLSMIGMIKKILERKIKLKGLRKLLILLKVFTILSEENK